MAGGLGRVNDDRCVVVAVIVIGGVVIIVGLVKVFRGAVVVFVAVFLVLFVVGNCVIVVIGCHSFVVAKGLLLVVVFCVAVWNFGVVVVAVVFGK